MSRGRNGNSLQYFCLENAMDRGAWQATAHGVARRWAWLSTWHGTLTTRHYSMRPLLARLDFHHSFSICYITIICMMWLAHNQYKLLRLNNMHLNFIFKLYKFYQVSLYILGSLNGSGGKDSACSAGDLGSIPGSERYPGGGNGNPL